MRKSIGILFLAIGTCVSGLMWPGAASAQTALEQLESRLHQQPQGDAKPGSPAAPAVTPSQPQPPSSEGQTVKTGGQGWLGVVADDESDRGRGVRVLEVTPDGPAAKAGFRVQDLITSIGNIRVRQMSELADMIEMYKPGDAVSFEVQRDGKSQKLQATLGQRPATRTETPPPPAPATKPEEPMLLPPQPAPATGPAKIPSAAPDDRSRIEALEHRVQQLEQRVADLERALKREK